MNYNWTHQYKKSQLSKEDYGRWLTSQERIMYEDRMYQQDRVDLRTGARGEVYETIDLRKEAQRLHWPKNFPLTIKEYLKGDWMESY